MINTKNDESQSELINKLIFSKYKIINRIGKGNFSRVYLVQNKITKKLYAAKLEEKVKSRGILEKETCFLCLLKGYGIPEVITYGHSGKYFVLIEQLLGKSLLELFKKSKNKIKDACMTAIQLIDRLRFIHSKYIVHRDIKPENFLVGYPDSSNIYIIDFGLSRKYRSSRTGNHIKFYVNKAVPGTICFLSLNASAGIESTRRDDLESLAYMLIYLCNGKLPWNDINGQNINECLDKIYLMKKTISLPKLCKNLPNEFITFTKYTRQLKFEQEPDYNYLKNLFIHALKTMNETNYLKFSWTITEKFFSANLSSNDLRIRCPFHKSSSRIRLLKKIEKSHSPGQPLIKKNNTFFNKGYKNLIKSKSEIAFINNEIPHKDSILKKQNSYNNIKNDKNNNIIKLQKKIILRKRINNKNSCEKKLIGNKSDKNFKIINFRNYSNNITNRTIINNKHINYFIKKNNNTENKKKIMFNNNFINEPKPLKQLSTINNEESFNIYTNRKKIDFAKRMKYIPLILRKNPKNKNIFTGSNLYLLVNNSWDCKNRKYSPINRENILSERINRTNSHINYIQNRGDIYINNSNFKNNFTVQSKLINSITD